MAERTTNPFDAPVPGQSLTDTPRNYPWEHAPQFSTVEDASMQIWEGLHSDAAMEKVIVLLEAGLTVEEITKVIVFAGFVEGKFNPDVGLLLTPIVAKMILAIGKKADIILNFSYDWLPIWMTLNIDIPIAHIISMGSESFVISNLISKVYSKYPNNFAFHTKIQASDFSFIENPIVIGNGFKLDNYDFQDFKNGPLGWVGRIAPEKGLEDAAYVANALGEKLNVWGIVQDESYALKIEKMFSPGTLKWKGFLETKKLQKELGTCRALLNTPKWNEAYGNVVVEALACGVPVLAYKRGGPSEIIEHGKTGYLVKPDDKESLLRYLKIINNIDRNNCRKWVEDNASSNIFANKVVNWLSRIIKES